MASPILIMCTWCMCVSEPEALIEITSDKRVWDADTQEERLRLAFTQFTAECRRHGVSCWDLTCGPMFACFQVYLHA